MEDKHEITYEIFEDGYDISIDGEVKYRQRDPYSKLFKPDGTYEENAELHVQMIEEELNPSIPEPTPEEILRGDVDYIALMEDLDLPSYNE